MTQSIIHPSPDRSASPSMIRRAAAHLYRSSTGVLVATTAGTIMVRMVSTVFLTRLLSPDMFGVAGIIGSIFFFVNMMTDLGFQAFVVRHPRGDETHFRDVIWTVHVWRGLLITVFCMALSPVAAAVLQKPDVALPLTVACLVLFFNGITSLSLITALRRDGARLLSMFDLGLAVFQTVLSIALAVWLRNVWAMVIGMIAQSAARALLSYVMFPDARHRFAADRALGREFWRFSRVILASSFIALLLSQTDKLVLARIFSLSEFGLYAVAGSLAAVPGAFVGSYFSRVIYPVYTAVWNGAPQDLRHVFYAARWRVSCLYAFAAGGLVGGAPFVVRLLYDPRYLHAATYLAILAISTAIVFSTRAAAELMTAAGEVSSMLKINLARLIWLAAAGALGFWMLGSIGVIWAVGTIEAPALLYCWHKLHRMGMLSPAREAVQLGLIAAGAGCGALFSTAARLAFPGF